MQNGKVLADQAAIDAMVLCPNEDTSDHCKCSGVIWIDEIQINLWGKHSNLNEICDEFFLNCVKTVAIYTSGCTW